MTDFPTEAALREHICHVGRLLHQQGYVDGASGNISARLSAERILATPSGLAKGFLSPDELIIVDMDGQRPPETINDENAHLKPTSELLMHLECYHQRDDVNGVVHAHPPTATALTIVGYDFQQCIIPEMVVILGLVPTTPYATPASAENRDAIQRLIREHDAILLSHHGSLTVADSVWEAYMRLESLEHGANILHKVEQLGGPKQGIPPEKMKQLIAFRKKLGHWRPGDEERFAPFL